MLWPETNRKIAEAFDNGILPTMVYINKQNYERQPMKRPLHSHESVCELLLVYKGEGTYLLKDKKFPVSEGSIICYNQGDLHEMAPMQDKEIGTYCIGITNVRKKGLPMNFLTKAGQPCVRKAGSLFPFILSLCEQMYELEGTGKAGNLAVQLLCASLVVLIDQIEEDPLSDTGNSREEIMVTRIRNYLDEHFVESISLETAADALGCSQTYISHLFKRVTGQSPMQYVIRRRIGYAQTLLISTELSATEIATRVGYNNTNYFCTLFAKVVGVTPVRYRNHYKSESKGMKHQL
ncbi:MAG: AraC family transcriptional regulator [Ruminococcus sp.]